MGCITSKAITRSMSIREELRHGFQSRSAAWEELLTTSHTHNDHLFAFLGSSNANTTNLITLPSTPTNPDSSKFTRSKSCHTLREDNENMTDFKHGKRSLSFHTVEEYDALLDGIRAEYTSAWDDVELQGSTSLTEDESCDSVDSAQVETGWKRKAVARGLTSLDISPVQVPAIARLRQKMVEQAHIYSPGTYVTPKFGSYNAPTITMPQDESKQDPVFSPELLAAFEDCMQQLQVEEDTILKHMVEYPFENQVANSSNMYKAIDL